jgi:hypothetical protein
MRSFFENKRLVLLLAALALGALTVLAISLNDVPFRAAERFRQEEAESTLPPAEPLPQIQMDIPLWKQLLVVSLVVLLLILVIMLLSPQWRKRLLWLLLKALIWAVAIYILLTNPLLAGILLQLLTPNRMSTEDDPTGNDAFTPIPVFEPPQVSPALSYVISFAFALMFLAVIWALYRGWQRYLQVNAKKSLDEIARIARSSLDDLSSGRNSSDVIINCYLRMSEVVSSKRHLQREIAMTPHEFALHLERAGLPGEAVSGLTRLFEGVRYGDRKSGSKDVNEAVRCLTTILHYCGEPV